jgi:DNA-directed RNA polymerase specialized sigma24 family protein
MTGHWPEISEQVRGWFFERDARAYPVLSAFCIAVARYLGAGADAEDVTQSLLLDLLRLRDRGTLDLPTASELVKYLWTSIGRRTAKAGKHRGRYEVSADPGEIASPTDAPDAAVRRAEHLELCLQLMHHALDQIQSAAATHAVLQRIFERHVLGRDVESLLEEAGLLGSGATPEQRLQQRNNENRRQSRARAVLLPALEQLSEATLGSTSPCHVTAGSRRVPFNVEDVRAALQLARSLARSEKTMQSKRAEEEP